MPGLPAVTEGEMNYMIMIYETEAAFRARSNENKSAY